MQTALDTTFEDLDKQRGEKDKEVQDKFEAIGTTITELEAQREAQRAQDEEQRTQRAKEIDTRFDAAEERHTAQTAAISKEFQEAEENRRIAAASAAEALLKRDEVVDGKFVAVDEKFTAANERHTEFVSAMEETFEALDVEKRELVARVGDVEAIAVRTRPASMGTCSRIPPLGRP